VIKVEIVFIINPEAGKKIWGMFRKRFCKKIRRQFPQAEIFFTEPKGNNTATDLARVAQNNGAGIIGVRGGDGTLNQVINGLDFSRPRPTIGIIPAGTGNDFAKALGIPSGLKAALRVIAGGKIAVVDIGIVNGRYFANTVSVGLDAEINNRAHKFKPYLRFIGLSPFAYIIAGLCSMKGIDYPEVKLMVDDRRTLTKRVTFAAVTNSYRYGRGFKINPLAKLNDGWLNLCIAAPVGRLTIPWYMVRMRMGNHHRSHKFSFSRFQKLVIEANKSLPFQIDGEVHLSQSKVEISVLPKALKILVP
jgi:YegS/Rv2252/BmrU family lipid kinase